MIFRHRWTGTAIFVGALFGVSTAPAGAVDYTITDPGTLDGTYTQPSASTTPARW